MERAGTADLSGCHTECPGHFCWPFTFVKFSAWLIFILSGSISTVQDRMSGIASWVVGTSVLQGHPGCNCYGLIRVDSTRFGDTFILFWSKIQILIEIFMDFYLALGHLKSVNIHIREWRKISISVFGPWTLIQCIWTVWSLTWLFDRQTSQSLLDILGSWWTILPNSMF